MGGRDVVHRFVESRGLAHAADSVKIGDEISSTGYVYKPRPIRALEIRADILALEEEKEGWLGEIIGKVAK